MAINFGKEKLSGFDKTLQLIGEGYAARPVTLTKDSIANLEPTDGGRYIIPQGTFLVGETSSLLENPDQLAVAANISVTYDTAVVDSAVDVKSVVPENFGYVITCVKASTSSTAASVAYVPATKAINVTLETDSSGSEITTAQELVDLINTDPVVGELVTAKLHSGVLGSQTISNNATATTSGGGVQSVSGNIDGILYHHVDVTDGEATGAMMISGYVNIDNMPFNPGSAIREKLTRITFGRIDG